MAKNIAMLGILIVCNPVFAQETIVLRNGNLLDGMSDHPIQDAMVTIQDGRIASVLGSESVPADRASVFDLDGRWVLPGLIDAHAHLGTLEQARGAVKEGVTTVRMLHVPHFVDVGMRELHQGGMRDLPEVLAAGYMIRPDMFTDTFVFEPFILDFPTLVDLVESRLAGATSVRRLVRANTQRGVDWIKILATERGGDENADPRKRTFTDDELRAIVDEAQNAQLSVAAHAHGDEGAAAAVRAGVGSIEHGSYLSDVTLGLIRARGVCLVPTIGLGAVVSETPQMQNASPKFKKRNAELFASAHPVARRAWEKGVLLATGTDFPSVGVSGEVAELVGVGIPPLDAIKAATSGAAECVGIGSRTGSIRPGYEADIIVIQGDPVVEIAALEQIVLVINDGEIVLNKLTR